MTNFAIVTPIKDATQTGHGKRLALNVAHIVSISPVYGNREAVAAVAAVPAKPATTGTPEAPAVAASPSTGPMSSAVEAKPAVPAVPASPATPAIPAVAAKPAVVNGEIGSTIQYLSGMVRVEETVDEIVGGLGDTVEKPAA